MLNLNYKYKGFLYEMLMESLLVTNKEFIDIIATMKKYNSIANKLYDMIENKRDIKTNHNFISTTDKNDEISFIPDNQYQRLINSEKDPKESSKNISKVGRLVRQIINRNQTNDVNEHDIEIFVNHFKSIWEWINDKSTKTMLVEGEDIKHWYNCKRYYSDHGTLGSSCMRHHDISHYMEIYAANPDKISLMIMIKETEKYAPKLLARALVWKLNSGETYIDRIYSGSDYQVPFLIRWARENISGELLFYDKNDHERKLYCDLKNVEFDAYPYMDTMMFIYKKIDKSGKPTGDGIISNEFERDKKNYAIFTARDTEGEIQGHTHIWSKYLESYIPNKDAVFIESIRDYIRKEDAAKSEWIDKYFLKDECVWSEKVEDWIPVKNKSYETIDHPKYGIILKSMIKKILTKYDESNNDPYLIFIGKEKLKGMKIEESIIKKDMVDYFEIFSPQNQLLNNVMMKKTDGITYEGNIYPKFLCYETYTIKNENDSQKIGLVHAPWNPYMIYELDSKIFGIDIIRDQRNKKYIHCLKYCEFFRESDYSLIIDMIKKSNIDEDKKNQRLQVQKYFHEYLLENYKSYVIKNIVKDSNFLEINYEAFKKVYTNFDIDKEIEKLKLFKNISEEEELSIRKYLPLGIFLRAFFSGWGFGSYLESLIHGLEGSDIPDRIIDLIITIIFDSFSVVYKDYYPDRVSPEFFRSDFAIMIDNNKFTDEDKKILKKIIGYKK